MLAFFRMLTQSRITWIILGIPLVASLMLIGNVRQNLTGLFTQDLVIVAGNRTLSSAEFKREFESTRQRAQQQQPGQPLSVDDMVAQGADQQILLSLAQRESIAEQERRDGLSPSDDLVVEQIRKISAFFDPITGKFDQKTYVQRLSDNGLTPEVFQGGLRDEMANEHLAAAFVAGLKPPRLLSAAFTDYEFQAHQFSYFLVDPKTLGAPSKPTDDQLKALMTANAAALTTPETRVFTVVHFSAKALLPTITADPAEVKKRYDFRKDTLSTPEKRSLVQIPAKTAADAQAIAAKLAQGQDPAAVAKGAGVEPVNYTDQPKGGIADPKVADAAFALAEGKSSGPIQGQLGLAVVKVLKVTPGHEVTLDEARPKIEDEVKAEAAANKAYELTQKYQDAHDKGSNIVDAAKVAGVPAQALAPVKADGAGADGKPLGLSAKLLKEGFGLSQGQESDVVQDDKGEYFAVRADKVIPPQPPTLDKDRDALTKAFQREEIGKRLDAKLAELSARVKKGEALEAVAKSVGAKVMQATINQADVQRNQQMQTQQIALILEAKAGDVLTSGAAVVKIAAIQPPSASVVAGTIGQAQQEVARQVLAELQEEARTFARASLKTRTNLALARQAIGAAAQSSTPAAPAQPGLPAPAGRAQ